MGPNEDKTSSSEQVAEEQGAVAKPEAPAEKPKAPEAPKSGGSPISERTRTIVVGVLAALFLIFALVQTVSLNSARNDLAEARTSHSAAQAELKQESQRQQALFTATSLAWGLKPPTVFWGGCLRSTTAPCKLCAKRWFKTRGFASSPFSTAATTS
ncbi:MAG: hypothetical protein UZ18_ATM001001604 [Armatimonadetes bacterium OLB18]|nr:MAG: hypothetical protein UZ18_ATM001001604 [Armatimonadetes bacterium OLB18]